MVGLVSTLSVWFISLLLMTILLTAFWKRVPVYEVFIEGAKGGFQTAVDLIPHLVAMMVAVTVFRESGAMDLLVRLIAPVGHWLGIPEEVMPLALIRSISGSGSLAITTDIIDTYGPDSFLGRLASTMYGSSDTTLFVLAVYFGAVGIRNSRYALKVGLLADFVAVIASVFIVRLVFAT
jgi:spore maturation protein B